MEINESIADKIKSKVDELLLQGHHMIDDNRHDLSPIKPKTYCIERMQISRIPKYNATDPFDFYYQMIVDQEDVSEFITEQELEELFHYFQTREKKLQLIKEERERQRVFKKVTDYLKVK